MTDSLFLSLISAGCILSGVLLGFALRSRLPEPHLSADSKDTVKVGASMIATVSALVLGLLVASAKSKFDATEEEMTQRGAKIIFLNRVLVDYGPGTEETRELLRRSVAATVQLLWPDESTDIASMGEYERMQGMEATHMALLRITPQSGQQRRLYDSAQELLADLRLSRWVMIERGESVIPLPFLVVLLFWLTVLHISFGLFAPRNGTVVAVLLTSALSVSAAIFIVLDMSRPLQGVFTVSSGPMRKALSHLSE